VAHINLVVGIPQVFFHPFFSYVMGIIDWLITKKIKINQALNSPKKEEEDTL
jgi:hypothetical protein